MTSDPHRALKTRVKNKDLLADSGHVSSRAFYTNPVDIHGTAATTIVPINRAIMYLADARRQQQVGKVDRTALSRSGERAYRQGMRRVAHRRGTDPGSPAQ